MRAAVPGRILLAIVAALLSISGPRASSFDHDYTDYAGVLHHHLRGNRVDYAALRRGRAALDAVVAQFAEPGRDEVDGWSRDQRLAFWINAYNLFTLRAIVD